MSLQIDNSTHFNRKKEVEKATEILKKAKKIKRKVIFVKKGITGEMLTGSLGLKQYRVNSIPQKRKRNAQKAKEMFNENKTIPQIAKKLSVSEGTVRNYLKH